MLTPLENSHLRGQQVTREREALYAENRRLRTLLREHADWHAGSEDYDQSKMGVETELVLAIEPGRLDLSFQARVAPWMLSCFGARISSDVEERCDRFLEEAIELAQSLGHGRERAHALVDYVYEKDDGEAGDPAQEAGGTTVTLAALCLAAGIHQDTAAETELARISSPEMMAKIRAKQAAKPVGSALPVAFASLDRTIALIRSERRHQATVLGYSAEHDDDHDKGQLARAAACYAITGSRPSAPSFSDIAPVWPWRADEWAPRSREFDLVRAAALLVAELERLNRAAGGRPFEGARS